MVQMKKAKFVGLGVVVAIAIAVSIAIAVGPSNNYSAPTTAANPSAVINVEGLTIDSVAPDFQLTDPAKGIVTKQMFAGKPLFVFFTTTWCTPCQIGAQNLAKYDDETGGNAFNVLIVFVDDRETDSQFIEWKNKFGRGDWYVAKGIEMAKTYNVQYLDTKYVFDKNGIIKWIDIKPLPYSTIDPVMSQLLGA